MKANVLDMTDGAIIQALLLPIILSADRDNNVVLLRHMLHILMPTLVKASTIELTIHLEVVVSDQVQILLDSEVEWQKTLLTAADQVATVTINLTLASVDPSS